MSTMRSVRLLLLVLALGALFARPVVAAPFTWEFIGVVGGSNQLAGPALIDLIPVGTPVTFTVSFDPAATDSCGFDNRGQFGLSGASVAYLGLSYAASSGGLEVNNPAGNCAGDGPETPSQEYVQRLGFSTAPFGGGFLSWTALGDGDQLPSVVPSVADFQLNFRCLVCANGIYGSITEVRRVPEPALLSLFAFAVVAIAWRHGRVRS